MISNVCVVKTCTCANGAPASGVNCVSHGASSCVGGDYDQSGNFKSCFCNAGVAAYGSVCPTHGTRFCLSCNAGYTLVDNACHANNCNVAGWCYGGTGNGGSSGGLKVCFCNAGASAYRVVLEICHEKG